MIHLDQLEFLPIFPYSELLIWMLPAPNVTYHSYFDSVSQLFLFWQTKDLSFYQCIVDLRIFFFDVKKSSALQHMDLPVVLRTGSYIGSTDT